MTDLRPCSRCLFYSQANPHHYALSLPYVRLRYSFGGHRPSETTHHKFSLKKISIKFLKRYYLKDAYPINWR